MSLSTNTPSPKAVITDLIRLFQRGLTFVTTANRKIWQSNINRCKKNNLKSWTFLAFRT
jgi:hypothetical protein